MSKPETTKPFYNSTIPSDWEIMSLDELGELKNGINKDKEEFGHGFPLVGLMDVFDIPKVYNGEFSLVNTTENERRDFDLRKGDVLFVRSSVKPTGVGLTTLVCQDMPNTTFSGFLIRFRTNGKLDFEFKAHCFFEDNFRQRLLNKSTISANTNINQVALKSLKIAIPSLHEQKAIANILSLMDTAINKNNLLIAKKELQKKWLIQNLLNGKKRLKMFEKEKWKEIHIHNVAKEVSLKNRTDKQLTVLSCTKYDGLVPSLEYFGRRIFSDDVSTYKVVPKNHFAYATNHIEEGSIGYQEIFDEALISPIYTVFKTDASVNDAFFYKLLKSHKCVYQYQARMEGSIDRRGGLRWDAFSIIKIQIPSLKEQTAIAKVLQAADKEIQLLKIKTEKLREQKKGLMQVLLTGKKRLIIKE
jgi:type I restriction enzyme S subunit